MSKIKTPIPHAPWRKRILIPLWTLQLGLALFQFAWNLTIFIISVYSGPDSGTTPYDRACSILLSIFGLAISIIIITSIVKFSRFSLSTLSFVRENAVSVALGGVGTILSFTSNNAFSGIFVVLVFVFSIALLVYAVLVRRRVGSGVGVEMMRSGKGEGEVEGKV